MKKYLLIFLAFILMITVSYGQTNIYHPFPDSNAFWGVDGRNIFYSYRLNSRYGLNGDTILNGKTYSKVYSLFDSTLTNTLSTYFAAIREQDKRVYTVIENAPEEILYDFNLSEGDTITFHYSLFFHEPQNFSRIVTQVDSVQLFNGEYRKRFHFDPIGYNSMPDEVIEGIGSVIWQGLFNPLINDAYTNGDVYSFECFKQNETIIFLNNPECDHCFCNLLTGIKKTEKEEIISLSPNPFSVQTTLQTASYLNNATVTIFNTYGQQLKQMTNLSGQTITLNREGLPGGLYFLQLAQNNRILLTAKLIITSN